MWILLLFGVIGYLMRKFRYEPGPLVLAFVLGPILETAFRQSLIISNGNPAIFVTKPISLFFLCVAALLVLSQLFSKKKKAEAEV
jgi:putative tricarboxylic transport membrane protein